MQKQKFNVLGGVENMSGLRRMMLNMRRALKVILHLFGLACLGGCVCYTILVIINIYFFNVFVGFEYDKIISLSEVLMVFYSLVYFIYVFTTVIHQMMNDVRLNFNMDHSDNAKLLPKVNGDSTMTSLNLAKNPSLSREKSHSQLDKEVKK